MNIETKALLINDILDLLFDNYQVGPDVVQGQAISFLRKSLTSKRQNSRWKNLPQNWEFEELLEELDFKVVEAKTKRNQKARIVTI